MLLSRKRIFVQFGLFIVVLCIATRSSNIILELLLNDPTSKSHLNATTTNNTFTQQNAERSKLQLTKDIQNDIILTFDGAREDRMGRRIQQPLGAWLVAKYHGWNFCSPPDEMAAALSFPICSDDHLDGEHFTHQNDNITKPGVYYINQKSNSLWDTIKSHEGGNTTTSMFTQSAVSDWRDMILNANTSRQSELQHDLWTHPNSIRIAVHVRRGDFTPTWRNVWISDGEIISLIELAKYYIYQRRGADAKIEVHLFSEDYGTTNWTLYENVVDELHLAPQLCFKGCQDIELNLRDWKHFVQADVLVVGGTFSLIPAYARPDPGPDGLPMTITRSRFRVRKFIPWKYYPKEGKGGMLVVDLPNETTAAKLGARNDDIPNNDTVAKMMHGLCAECKNAQVPGAYKCSDRIQRYVPAGSDFSKFVEVQKGVSTKGNGHCSKCDPATCPVRVEKHGTILPVDSVIETRYKQYCPAFHENCPENEFEYLTV